MIHVMHIITGLERGGAETVLFRLTTGLDPARFHHTVVSLTDLGPVGAELCDAGISVHALGLARSVPNPLALPRLIQLIRKLKPDVVQTWMYHADLLGGVAARLAGIRRLAWNIRNSTLDPAGSRRLTRLTVRICARLSRSVPRRIVSCSEVARAVHEAVGYDTDKFEIIPNGVDVDKFRPDPDSRRQLRMAWGMPDDAFVIGMVARDHPQKDLPGFVASAAMVVAELPAARFVLCGPGLNAGNEALTGALRRASLVERFVLLGEREDVARVLVGFDVFALTSAYGEGFPNVVVEAMAAGVPCAVTHVGDAGLILGACGRTVAPRDPAAMAQAWLDLASADRQALGVAARQRVTSIYSKDRFLGRYASLYRSLAGRQEDSSCAE